MEMTKNDGFLEALTGAINARAAWLEKTELPRMKEEFRIYQNAYLALYNIFLKKHLVEEDPYKDEVKRGELEVPETSSFTDAARKEQLSIRLSNYDSQLDFLVNFYQFSVDFLNLEKIKRMLGLVRYIDWPHMSNNSDFPNTKAVMELLNQLRPGTDPMSSSIINESLVNLSRTTGNILVCLKELTEYKKEEYKFNVRTKVMNLISPAEANQVNSIKRKFAAAMPGQPFYPDLIEDIIREDAKNGKPLRDKVLKILEVPDAKPKITKPVISYKAILIDGLAAIGSSGSTLTEIAPKMDENETLLENKKKGILDKIKRIIRQILNKEPDPIIYNVSYVDPAKGTPVREQVDFFSLRAEIDRKSRVLIALASRGGAAQAKMEAMEEEQLLGMLERNIREVQIIHKTLSALDEFFKLEADKDDRDKVKGIKPELATIKNAIVRANQKRYEYSAQKEEEQLKRLGISSEP
jgi:hypothetical protein